MKKFERGTGMPPRPARRDCEIPPARRVREDAVEDAQRPERRDGSFRYAGRPFGQVGTGRRMFAEPPENLLVGRNPIREAIRAGAPIDKLLVASGDLSGAARDIVRMAKEAGIVVQFVERNRLDQIYPAHQGLLAFRAAREYSSVEEILEYARERNRASPGGASGWDHRSAQFGGDHPKL